MDSNVITVSHGSDGRTRYYIGANEISAAEMGAMQREGKMLQLLESIEKRLAVIEAKLSN